METVDPALIRHSATFSQRMLGEGLGMRRGRDQIQQFPGNKSTFMTGFFYLDWSLLSVSLFNAILMLWLGLTVLLNARHRAPEGRSGPWGFWMAAGSLLLGGVFFIFHSALLGFDIRSLLPALDILVARRMDHGRDPALRLVRGDALVCRFLGGRRSRIYSAATGRGSSSARLPHWPGSSSRSWPILRHPSPAYRNTGPVRASSGGGFPGRDARLPAFHRRLHGPWRSTRCSGPDRPCV